MYLILSQILKSINKKKRRFLIFDTKNMNILLYNLKNVRDGAFLKFKKPKLQ